MNAYDSPVILPTTHVALILSPNDRICPIGNEWIPCWYFCLLLCSLASVFLAFVVSNGVIFLSNLVVQGKMQLVLDLLVLLEGRQLIYLLWGVWTRQSTFLPPVLGKVLSGTSRPLQSALPMSLSMQLKVLLTGPPCPRKSDTLLRFNICSRKPRLGPYQPETAACIEVKMVGLHRGENGWKQ